MRHGDACDATELSNSRRAEHRQNESRHGGDAKQADARQGDARHGDVRHRDSRPSDGRNIGSGEPAARSSRPGRGVAAPSLDVEPSRQGVFEQFVKSSSKTPSTVESDGVATKAASRARQSLTHGKTKHRTSSFNDSKSEELSSECRLTGFKPESESKQQPAAAYQSKCSSDGVPDPSRNVSPSSLPSGRTNGVRKEMNGSPPDRRTTFGKGNEKLSGGRVNGIHQGLDLNGKNSEVEKKLKLHISKVCNY